MTTETNATGRRVPDLDQAEYQAGYLAGVNLAPVRAYSPLHERHYARGIWAGIVADWCGVSLWAST